MDEKPKSIWKKSFAGRTALVIWLAVAMFTVMLGSFFIALANFSRPISDTLLEVGIFAGGFLAICLILIYILWPLLRWLFGTHWRRSLFALACLITLIALAYAEEDWRGKRAWEKFKHEWEAKGERFDYASVVPPTVPDEQNFAMAPIIVESMKAVLGPKNSVQWYGNNFAENGRTNFTDRLALEAYHLDSAEIEKPKARSWQKGELTDLRAWQSYYRMTNYPDTREVKVPVLYPGRAFTDEFPVAPQPQTPAQDVLLALSKYDSAIEELRVAGLRPYSRFPLYSNVDHPFDTLLPHLADLKRCTQVLELRAVAELQNNESEKALADVKLILRMAESMRTERFLISQLVRIAMVQISLQPVYEGLANRQWSDAQLVALDAELAKLDFLAAYGISMRGERTAGISALDYLRRERKAMYWMDNENAADKFSVAGILSAVAGQMLPSAFFYQNELTLARMHQQYTLPMVDMEKRTVSPARVQNLQAESRRDLNYHWWPYKFFARMLFPAVENAVKKLVYAQTSVDLARVAIALERYRLARGEYPESLDVLGSQFIDKIPHDVIGGQPLKYRREANGQFTLYSVGWNETDDGGVVVFKKGSTPEVDTDKGDWVWRYPAK